MTTDELAERICQKINKPKAEVMAVLAVFHLIHDAIREAGPEGLPSGPLYSALCGRISLATYQSMILKLKQLNKITEKGHVLYWLKQED